MAIDLFRGACLDLDADGGSSVSGFHNGTENIFWKHKVNVRSHKNMTEKRIHNSLFYNVQLPMELARYLNVGDNFIFIDEELNEEDLFFRYYDGLPASYEKSYLEWKDFLCKNELGIYVYNREIILGKSRLNIQAFYYDVAAVYNEE